MVRRKFLFILLIAIFGCFLGVAQSMSETAKTTTRTEYYVCISSFKVKDNADRLQKTLADKGIPSIQRIFIASDGTTFYRVLINNPDSVYEGAVEKREAAKVNEVIKNLNINGKIWVCNPEIKADGIKQIVNVPQNKETSEGEIKEGTQLVQNEVKKIPLSEEKPYSILVKSYAEEQNAVADKNRLVEQNIDAYILKKYNDKELFRFDLHAGAFTSQAETVSYQKALEEKGLLNTKITNYNDFANEVNKYNDVVQTEKVVVTSGKDTIPEVIPEDVKICLKQFPVNRNFQIENILIYDLDAIRKLQPSTEVDSSLGFIYDDNAKSINAISSAEYRDDLFNKEVTIIIATSDTGTFIDTKDKLVNKVNCTDVEAADYSLPYGILHSYIYKKGNDYFLCGSTNDGKMFLSMTAKDFSRDEFIQFITKSYADSSILAYPQLRKTLFILPAMREEGKDFLWFKLDKVQYEYAEEKGYAQWAIPIVGHWCAEGHFNCNHDDVSIEYFDLDYDYTAKKIHGLFMDEKKENAESEENHEVTVCGKDGWYIENYSLHELSFSVKSYIVAIDSSRDTSIKEDILKNFAYKLQIWDELDDVPVNYVPEK